MFFFITKQNTHYYFNFVQSWRNKVVQGKKPPKRPKPIPFAFYPVIPSFSTALKLVEIRRIRELGTVLLILLSFSSISDTTLQFYLYISSLISICAPGFLQVLLFYLKFSLNFSLLKLTFRMRWWKDSAFFGFQYLEEGEWGW